MNKDSLVGKYQPAFAQHASLTSTVVARRPQQLQFSHQTATATNGVSKRGTTLEARRTNEAEHAAPKLVAAYTTNSQREERGGTTKATTIEDYVPRVVHILLEVYSRSKNIAMGAQEKRGASHSKAGSATSVSPSTSTAVTLLLLCCCSKSSVALSATEAAAASEASTTETLLL